MILPCLWFPMIFYHIYLTIPLIYINIHLFLVYPYSRICGSTSCQMPFMQSHSCISCFWIENGDRNQMHFSGTTKQLSFLPLELFSNNVFAFSQISNTCFKRNLKSPICCVFLCAEQLTFSWHKIQKSHLKLVSYSNYHRQCQNYVLERTRTLNILGNVKNENKSKRRQKNEGEFPFLHTEFI